MNKNKIFITISVSAMILFGISGCEKLSDEKSSATNQSTTANSSQSSTEITKKANSSKYSDHEHSSNGSNVITKDTKENEVSKESNVVDQETQESLSNYSSNQIEYARIWLQLGPNPEIEKLYVQHIPAGTLINPNDQTSEKYPVDVIQLAGPRLVDGSVTYSGNGDGTVHVYNVPLRWEKNVPEDLDENYMSDYTQNIIEDAKLIYVNPGNDEEIISLIKLLNDQY